MLPRQALQFLSGPCMASLRFQHILIDVYLFCKVRRLFKFTSLPTSFTIYQRSERWIVEPEKAKKPYDGAGKLPRLALGNSFLGFANPWVYQRLSGVASPSTLPLPSLLVMPFFTSR